MCVLFADYAPYVTVTFHGHVYKHLVIGHYVASLLPNLFDDWFDALMLLNNVRSFVALLLICCECSLLCCLKAIQYKAIHHRKQSVLAL